MSKSMELTEAILKELMPDIVTKRGTIMKDSDLNDVTQPGGYLLATNEVKNRPSGATQYGSLLVFPGYYLAQVLIPTQAPDLYIRLKTSASGWAKWMKFSGVYL